MEYLRNLIVYFSLGTSGQNMLEQGIEFGFSDS